MTTNQKTKRLRGKTYKKKNTTNAKKSVKYVHTMKLVLNMKKMREAHYTEHQGGELPWRSYCLK